MSLLSVAQAQNVSPRTGNEPVRQVLTQEEFNNQQPEIQVIIKDNPHLYAVVPAIIVVDAEEFRSMPAEKQRYIQEHPLEYRVMDKPKDKAEAEHAPSGPTHHNN